MCCPKLWLYAIRESNMDVGGRTVEVSETEFAVRGRGYIKSLSDLEQIGVKNEGGVPARTLWKRSWTRR